MKTILHLIYLFTFILIAAAVWGRSISLLALAISILLMVAYIHAFAQTKPITETEMHDGYEEWRRLGMPPHLDRNINVVQFYGDLFDWKYDDPDTFSSSIRHASEFLDPNLTRLETRLAAARAWDTLYPFHNNQGYDEARTQWELITRQYLSTTTALG